MKTLRERFDAKWTPEPNTGCWLWHGALQNKGYGLFHIGSVLDRSRRRVLAHRLAYELYMGPIPFGLTIDHLCRVPCCVNPDHLEPVTHRENVLRGLSPQAMNAAKLHCVSGHPFDDVNTYHMRTGGR